jgi:hypothetical protein
VDPAAYLARLRVAHPDRPSALPLQLDALGYDVVWHGARCTTSSTTRSTTSRHLSARRSGRARAAHGAWLAA